MAHRLVKLDGRIGEGGGQVMRIAVTLAALTGTPLQISNIRGNRKTRGGAGLKAQHLACIKFLAAATDAQTTGCFLKSEMIGLLPASPPFSRANFPTEIKADSAACIQLVLQAVLPFLIFAGDEEGTPIKLRIHGGTNVSFSMSIDYTQQILSPVLKTFGIKMNTRVLQRGWSHGRSTIGCVEFEIHPLLPGQKLSIPTWPTELGRITKLDITIIVPLNLFNA